jgi:hypothetical protein
MPELFPPEHSDFDLGRRAPNRRSNPHAAQPCREAPKPRPPTELGRLHPSRVHRARADVQGGSPTSGGRPNRLLTCHDGSWPSVDVRPNDVRNVEVVGSSPITSTRVSAGAFRATNVPQRLVAPCQRDSSTGERCLHTAEAAGSKPASPTAFVLVTGLRSVARYIPAAARVLRVPSAAKEGARSTCHQ